MTSKHWPEALAHPAEAAPPFLMRAITHRQYEPDSSQSYDWHQLFYSLHLVMYENIERRIKAHQAQAPRSTKIIHGASRNRKKGAGLTITSHD